MLPTRSNLWVDSSYRPLVWDALCREQASVHFAPICYLVWGIRQAIKSNSDLFNEFKHYTYLAINSSFFKIISSFIDHRMFLAIRIISYCIVIILSIHYRRWSCGCRWWYCWPSDVSVSPLLIATFEPIDFHLYFVKRDMNWLFRNIKICFKAFSLYEFIL